MTSIFSWLNGISALMIVGCALTYGVYFTVHTFKTKNKTKKKIFTYAAILGYLEAIGFSGICLSFIWVLMGRDANEVIHIVPRISYSTAGLVILICLYLAWDIFFKPEYKKPVLIILSIGIIVNYLVIYTFMDTMVRIPKVPRGEILDDTLWEFRIAWWAMTLLLGSLIVFFSGSFIRLLTRTEGTVHKKVTYLFLGFTLTFICCVIDMMLISPFIFINRFFIVIAIIFWWLGFKEERPKQMKSSSKKKKDLDESTIAIIEKLGIDFTRPEEITEEEIAFYREQTICLVCKGLIQRYKYIFICPKCRALYCDSCARALENLENACWACNAPIDESKPVKLFKKEEDDIEISKKPQKK